MKTDTQIRAALRKVTNLALFARTHGLSVRTLFLVRDGTRPLRPITRKALSQAIDDASKE